MSTEQWRNIGGYKELYQISNCGQVRRLKGYRCKEQHLLKPGKSSQYPSVSLYKNGKPKTYRIHILILNTFIGPCPSGSECRHLDGNKQNNKLNNLKWGTHSENVLDAVKHKTHTNNSGQNNGRSKLTDSNVREIKRLLHTKSFTLTQIAKQFCVAIETIYNISANRAWRHI